MEKIVINFWDDQIGNSIHEFQKVFDSTGIFQCVGHENFHESIITEENKYLFKLNFVDINHGFNKDKKGMEIIKFLRQQNEDAYISGYSTRASESIKRESLQSGANDFFKKVADDEEWESTLYEKLNKLLIEVIKYFMEFDVKQKYKGVILDRGENTYLLKFRGEDREFQSRVFLSNFSHISKELDINDEVIMRIGSDKLNRNIIEYKFLDNPQSEDIEDYFSGLENSDIFQGDNNKKDDL